MFAVIKTGGKQYSVAAEDQLKVEKLAGEPGEMIELTEVMMVGETVGTPFVEGAMVTAEIVEQGRARKVIAFKKRRRQNSRRTIGHRQHYTLLQISEILTDGKKPSKKATGAAKKTKEPKVKDAPKEKADKKADAKAEKPASTAAAKSEKTDKKEADADKKKAEKPAAKADKKEADKPAAKADAQASAKKDDAKPAAKEKAKADAAPLFKSPAKGEKDKLTDLKGVGPVAEKQLNEQGITTFAQIAALTDAEITTIDENMPFSADQIKDWQAQAKEKAKG